jgi:hypothetical protein
MVVAMGCSSGGMNPVAPNDLTANASVDRNSQTHLWGYYDVYIDIPIQTATAVPNREAMFTANVTTFLNGKPAALGFHINETPIGADYIDVDIDVSLTHPFPGLPQYHGYDVRGVFMGDGSASLNYNPDLIYPVLGFDQYMLHDPVGGNGAPDGYTRWFNLPEFSTGGMPLFQYTPGKMASPGFAGTSTLNPYKYFADGLGTNDDLWTWLASHGSQLGRFSSGATNTRNYYIRFPNAKGMKYSYAVIANWEGTEPENHPSNAPEAVACSVVDNSDVFYVDPTVKGGNLILDISLFDWEYQPSTIYIESTVLSYPHEFTPSEMTPTGGGDNYFTYHVDIPADNILGQEGNELWVIAEYGDFDYTNEFGVPNNADTDPLAACFRNDLYVYPEPTTQAPHFIFTPKPYYDDIGPEGTTDHPVPTEWMIDFDASSSVGAMTYDWDFNGDGTYDFVGDSSPFRSYQYAFSPSATYPVTYQATLRINGASGPTETHPVVVAPGVYVDGDYIGAGNGTKSQPFSTIMEGINAAEVGRVVRVDAKSMAPGYYEESVTLKSGVAVTGDNWNGGTGKPKIQVNSGGGWYVYVPHVIGADASDVVVNGFDLTTNSFEIIWYGGSDNNAFQLIYLTNCTDVAVLNCRIGTTVSASTVYGIRAEGGSGITIAHNEITNLANYRSYNWWVDTPCIYIYSIVDCVVKQNEVHHINYRGDHNAGDAFSTYTTGLYAYDCTGASQVTNNLMYDFYDLSDGDASWTGYDYRHNEICAMRINDCPGMSIANNTINDFNPVGRDGSQAGAVTGVSFGSSTQPAESVTVKNNLISNLATTELTSQPTFVGAGFNSLFTLTLPYSCVYNLDLTNGGGGYYNLAVKGSGSYDNADNKNPSYGAPGPTFYHVNNPALKSDDGSEMGAFGGPDGDWVPPSQE